MVPSSVLRRPGGVLILAIDDRQAYDGLAKNDEANAMANISECLSKAAEFQSRAAIATDWQLKATFKDLARFYRQMAMYLQDTEQSDPKRRL
jgi:hypothetical protein